MGKDLLKKLQEEDGAEGEPLLKQIDWKGLEAELSKILKTPITVKPELVKRSHGTYIKWEGNEELVDKSGIFTNVFKSVKVAAFSTSTVEEVNKDNEYWCTISLRWEHKDGGSNGASLGSARYSLEKKTWEFKER